ncbi:hypothetical protein OG786_20965 [Streptomyces sp. NBC_00101]|uniref:hypothetical protein n=1 Tax=Streptomyces sp. NBC_00101 TaxID=2975651 RepID=UPI003245B6CD
MALLLAPHMVTVITRQSAVNPRGPRGADWDTAQRVTVQAQVEPGGSSENRDNRDQVATTYLVRLPPGTAVSFKDRLEWNGVTLEVNGDPLSWSGLAALDHIQLTATRVRG